MKFYLDLEDDTIIPDELTQFSKKENTLLLLTGYNSVKIFKTNAIQDNSYFDALKRELAQQYEVALQTKDETIATLSVSNDTQKSVYDLLLAEEKARRDEEISREKEKMKEFYEEQYNRAQQEKAQTQEIIDTLKQELVAARCSIENYRANFDKEVALLLLREKETLFLKEKQETEKTATLQEKYNELLLDREKEKNTELARNMQELKDAIASSAKGNVGRGQQGESFFYDLVVDTFSGYDGFHIVNTAKTGHAGDFHIQFKDFSILADSKNFIDTSGVSSTDRNKLKYDMKQNQHIKIAWLVSIDKPIRRFSKYPFMIELHDGVCYCYINSIKDYENPGKLLEMAWYACNFVFHTVLNQEEDVLILEKYKKNEVRVREVVSRMKRLSKQRYTFLHQLKENFDETEKDITEIVNNEIMSIRDEHMKTMETWWSANYERCVSVADSGPKLKSAPIFKKFHEEHPEIGEDVFKQILREIIPQKDIELPKSKTAQYTILNWHARAARTNINIE